MRQPAWLDTHSVVLRAWGITTDSTRQLSESRKTVFTTPSDSTAASISGARQSMPHGSPEQSPYFNTRRYRSTACARPPGTAHTAAANSAQVQAKTCIADHIYHDRSGVMLSPGRDSSRAARRFPQRCMRPDTIPHRTIAARKTARPVSTRLRQTPIVLTQRPFFPMLAVPCMNRHTGC